MRVLGRLHADTVSMDPSDRSTRIPDAQALVFNPEAPPRRPRE